MLRHFALILVVVVAVNVLFGRYRATALVDAGRVTKAEVSSFCWGTFGLLGGAFAAWWLVQMAADARDPLCLLQVPPQQPAGIAVWSIQAALSGITLWWLWFRNGADTLARLAPAFTSGPVLERQFSPRAAGLSLSALVVLAPLGNILVQLSGAVPTLSCQAAL